MAESKRIDQLPVASSLNGADMLVVEQSNVAKSVTVSVLGTGKEVTSNKVTSLSGSSTNTQYPSAKLLYDQLLTKVTIAQNSSQFSIGRDSGGIYAIIPD